MCKCLNINAKRIVNYQGLSRLKISSDLEQAFNLFLEEVIELFGRRLRSWFEFGNLLYTGIIELNFLNKLLCSLHELIVFGFPQQIMKAESACNHQL